MIRRIRRAEENGIRDIQAATAHEIKRLKEHAAQALADMERQSAERQATHYGYCGQVLHIGDSWLPCQRKPGHNGEHWVTINWTSTTERSQP